MAQVTALVDVPLSNVSNMMKPTGLIAETLLTPLSVKQTTGTLGKYGKGHLRVVDSRVVGRGAAPRVQLITRDITERYQMEKHALEGLVTEEDYRNVTDPFKAEEDETMALTLNLELGKEVGLAGNLANPSVITSGVTLSGTAQFNDTANSDPLGVADDAVDAIIAKTGKSPNVAIMDKLVFLRLRRHPQIWTRLGYTYNQSGSLSVQNVAEALTVNRLMIAEGFYNASREGQADNIQRIWGPHLWFAYIEDSAAPYQTTGGYYLTYEGKQPREVTTWPVMNPKGAKAIYTEDAYCMLISDPDCFYLVQNAIATS